MKKIIFISILICSISLYSQTLDDEFEKIKQVSTLSLSKYLGKISIGDEKAFGFNSRTEFDLIKIGEPYQIYYLSEELLNKSNIKDVILINANEWEVPLNINDESRCFLHIYFFNNKYEVMGIGYSKIAQELNFLRKNIQEKELSSLLYIPSVGGAYLMEKKTEFEDYLLIPMKTSLENIHNRDNYPKENFNGYKLEDVLQQVSEKQKLIIDK